MNVSPRQLIPTLKKPLRAIQTVFASSWCKWMKSQETWKNQHKFRQTSGASRAFVKA